MWPNIDQAFLDVVTAIKRALKKRGQKSALSTRVTVEATSSAQSESSPETIRCSNLRSRKLFTDFDKDRFRHEGFEYIAKFFENSQKELVSRNSGLD
jgi:hypothetical protein